MAKPSRPRRPAPRGDDREILHGIAPVEAALRARKRAFFKLWVRRDAANERVEAIVRRAEGLRVPVVVTDADELGRITHGGVHQNVVLGCGPVPLLDLRVLQELPAPEPLVLALDQIEDPQNLGGLIRTAAFLGATAVLMHRSHRAPLSAVVSKASAGLLESFPIAEVGNLANALQTLDRAGWTIVGSALDAEAVDYRSLDVRGRLVLVMGNEGHGLRPLTVKRCHHLVRIPRRGPAESLNVTVAAGVLLAAWEGARGTG